MISPLRDALATLLASNAGQGGDSPAVQVWDYRDDFSRLWNAVDASTPDSAKPKASAGPAVDLAKHQIIVWVDTPPGDCAPVQTSPYVSPLHWAFCARRAQRRGNPDTSPRISVLDLSLVMRTDEKRLWQTVNALRPDFLWWLRVFRLSDLVGGNGSVDALGPAFVEHMRSLMCPPRMPIEPDGERYLLSVLRTEFSDPQEPDDRHAIANILGPYILLGREPRRVPRTASEAAPHRMALRILLAECNMIGSGALSGDLLTPTDPPAGVRVILLDDQWQHGWGEWVCGALGTEFVAPEQVDSGPTRISPIGSIEICALSDPHWLVTQLAAGVDQRFQLAFNPHRDGGPLENPMGPLPQEILLLDLRLFAGDSDAEIAFIRALIPLCRNHQESKTPWRGFTKKELDDVEVWCNSSNPNGAADRESALLKARSFFARLIALRDHSFPIVIFSSTGHRDLIAPFEGYGNIITVFSKPRTFGGATMHARMDCEYGFKDALLVAQRITAARGFLRHVLEWASAGRTRAKEFANTFSGDTSVPWHYAEIYIDESGSPVKRVGGYVVVYKDDVDAPQELAQEFAAKSWGFGREQPLRRSQSRHYNHERHRFPEPADYWRKASSLRRAEIDRELELRAKTVRDAVSRHGLLAACVLAAGQGDGVGLPDGPDPLYRAVAASIVEFFLYDWLPALELAWGQDPLSLKGGVFLGSRSWPAEGATLVRQQWDFGIQLEQHDDPVKNASVKTQFLKGCPIKDHEGQIGYTDETSVVADASGKITIAGRSLDFGDAYPLVVGVARQRRSGDRVRRAAAVGMREFGRGQGRHTLPWPPQLPRQIHYASDDLLHDPAMAGPALDCGFRSHLSPGLTSLLQASRALDSRETLPRALQYLSEAAGTKGSELDSILPWVAVRCEPMLKDMSGPEFIQFATGVTMQSLQPHRPGSRSPRKSKPQTTVLSIAHAGGIGEARTRDSSVTGGQPSVDAEFWLVKLGPFAGAEEASKAAKRLSVFTLSADTRTVRGRFVVSGRVQGKHEAQRLATNLRDEFAGLAHHYPAPR